MLMSPVLKSSCRHQARAASQMKLLLLLLLLLLLHYRHHHLLFLLLLPQAKASPEAEKNRLDMYGCGALKGVRQR